MKTWRKKCKSPTTNTPPDLRHPWSRKTFSLCRHKMKGHPFSKKRPCSPKISNFARIPFQITSCAYQGTRQNLIVLDKSNSCMWACWIFLIEFCLFFVLCWKEIFEFVYEFFKHFLIILKQTPCALQGIRLYSHSASHDGWHVKYVCVLLKNF